MPKYSISCSAMDERDVALFKSLISIIGRGQAAEWVYNEQGEIADVVIVDADARGHAKLVHRPRAIVAYAQPDKTLIPNTFALAKPARARDFMELLVTIQTCLESQQPA
jgi:hypothetical protein